MLGKAAWLIAMNGGLTYDIEKMTLFPFIYVSHKQYGIFSYILIKYRPSHCISIIEVVPVCLSFGFSRNISMNMIYAHNETCFEKINHSQYYQNTVEAWKVIQVKNGVHDLFFFMFIKS